MVESNTERAEVPEADPAWGAPGADPVWEGSDTSTTASGSDGPRLREILQLIAAMLTLWTLWATVVLPVIPTPSGYAEIVLGVSARFVFWVVPCGVYLRQRYGGEWLRGLGLRLPRRGSAWLRLVIVTTLVAALLVAGTAVQQGISMVQVLYRLSAEASLRLRAPLFEELVFRGVIVSELVRWAVIRSEDALVLRARFWGALLLGALAFTAIHWPWWIFARGLEPTLELSPSLFITGLVLGVVFVQTRSLWPGVFLHWLNNELSQVLSG